MTAVVSSFGGPPEKNAEVERQIVTKFAVG
jgi:hypothetical protein